MNPLYSNEQLEHIRSFRETGYAEDVVQLLNESAGDDWEVYLYLELSRWKGKDLLINPSSRRKVVVCVGDESERTNYPFLDQVDIVFRNYLPQNQQGKILHIPVGPSREFRGSSIVPMAERKYNVFFSGNLHNGRAELYRVLTGAPPMPFALLHRLRWLFSENLDSKYPNSILRFSRGFHNGITPEEYAQVLGNSRIVLCPAGIENPETMRHFEAASLGSIVMTTPLPDAEVYRNAPFVVLSSWRELRSAVNKLLQDPIRMNDLHLQTLDWWHSTASAPAVAHYMLQKLHSLSAVNNN